MTSGINVLSDTSAPELARIDHGNNPGSERRFLAAQGREIGKKAGLEGTKSLTKLSAARAAG
jgi:hypothetical protein